MIDLSIRVDVIAGSSIRAVAKQAQALSDKLGIIVEYSFNEREFCAFPGGDYVTQIIEYYESLLKEPMV